MNNLRETYPVIIAGGGPVGLFLGLCLQRRGIPFLILEKQKRPHPGSRSLGIHPVSLELLSQLDVAGPFLLQGVKVYKGHAFTNSRKLGTLTFEDCPKPFNYILTLPQYRTEQILEDRLQNRITESAIVRGAELLHFSQTDDSVTVEYSFDGRTRRISGSYLIGCDGKHSVVRQQAEIPFEGGAYPDSYIMGDFDDTTHFNAEAAIFLCRQGLIESFPLPENRRRWVVKTSAYHSDPNRKDLTGRIKERIGHSLYDVRCYMLSSFGVQRHVARPMVKNRIVLSGDAAHVVNPIGGQGMNLGWLGAWDLCNSLQTITAGKEEAAVVLSHFEQRRRKAALNAIRRASMNMRLGREFRYPAFRNGLVRLMLNTPLSRLMARIFTMRGIERWVV